MPHRYRPVAATVKVSSGFGQRSGGFHRGIDFAAADGAPIYAAEDGTVAHVGAASGFGQWIVLRHPSGQSTVYGHMWNAFATGLKVGSQVRGGQLIAFVGSNGQSSGPHLHFEVHPGAWKQGSQIDPAPWLIGALEPGITPAPTPTPGGSVLTDPFTGALWSPSRHPRTIGTPRWIAVHTQEGGRTARGLAEFLAVKANKVSYHSVVDDRELLKVVAESDCPWSASNANAYAFHICLAGSYAAWSRGKWLETDASDGKNEDLELTNAARVIAWWCQKYKIPAEYIGGRGIPWGRDGICGHVDFGSWGGGHTDPGPNFPWDELKRRVLVFLAGSVPVPVNPVPVGPGGGAPVNPGTSPYFTGLLYRGSTGPQVAELQRRLKAAYRDYAGHLPVDADFGPLTEAAVREFQRRSRLVADGIVGPQTAAALKLKVVR